MGMITAMKDRKDLKRRGDLRRILDLIDENFKSIKRKRLFSI